MLIPSLYGNEDWTRCEIVFGPGSVFTKIDRYAFLRCLGVYSIVLPASVEILEEGCFRGLLRLEEVRFEGGSRLRRIEREVFFSSGLRSVLIPACAEFVHGSGLICEKLDWVDIEVGNRYLVSESYFLRSFDGRGVIRYFGRDPFLLVPDGVGVLCESSFQEPFRGIPSRTSLRRIVIPGSVEVIGTSAFENCSGLELCELVQPSQLARIESRAFLGCGSLRSMNFPASLQFIGVDCFAKCSDLSGLKFGSRFSMEHVFGGLLIDAFLSEVGIEPIAGPFELSVRDGELGHVFGGWRCESCEGTSVRYVPDYQK
jgi:hypothetical protein